MKYKRIIIKLSGEGLSNKEKGLAIDFETVKQIAGQIKEIQSRGVQVGVIVGGGNFWRGASAAKNGIPRSRADYIGMLATIMNSLALQSGFEANGVSTRVQSAVSIDQRVAEYYIKEKAVNYLEKGELVIFAGGTGRPFFTTDTTSTLVASEIGADIILMGKNGVDGIYTSDPKTDPNAKHIDEISYDQLLEKGLSVMDATAAAMARDNGINLMVFNIQEENALVKAIEGKIKHTKVVK
ncbi:UMP kinase [Mycoplasma marinum]|uniref:Uridylate kinase n=1 Tax=Mycoplasma marinum TaxID=1937190 RepID=A0A4R0XSR6_9MOLU|nr:UMP kinase [Mycoplasma marinum]TCG10767.1 UMP kinase [Mycoplasma marinum]